MVGEWLDKAVGRMGVCGGLTPSDLLHSSPHIPHIVLLEFGLQLPPVGVFTGPQHIPEFMLHSLQFFPVSRPERPLLLVKKGFQVIGDPRLIVREAAYSPGRHGGMFTEPRTRLWSDLPSGGGCGTVCLLSICFRSSVL